MHGRRRRGCCLRKVEEGGREGWRGGWKYRDMVVEMLYVGVVSKE